MLIQNKKMMGWGVAATFGRAMVLPLVKQTIMNSEVTIIGIAGGTGSGKTTVVKKIVEALPPLMWLWCRSIRIIMKTKA